MKKIIFPVLAALIIGGLIAFGLFWAEFGSVEETFINYLPN